jgi:hypothetical protein
LNFGEGLNSATDRVAVDPWAHRYVYRARVDAPPLVYSLGPNGVDEGGEGDDIVAPVK